MKKKIGIIGFFGNGNHSGGQEAKTYNIFKALSTQYGDDDVLKVDTLNWKKHPFKLLFKSIHLCFKCKNIIMLPAQNSLKIFSGIFVFFKKLNKFNLIYSVVGGWLPKYVDGNKALEKRLKKIDYILVETSSMKTKMESLGFCNVHVVYNFKFFNHSYTKKQSIPPFKHSDTLNVCVFSRIDSKKGVDDAIKAIELINAGAGKTLFNLDIYGKIELDYVEEFNLLIKQSSKCIQYKGFVEPEKSIEIVSRYFALLFPTHYFTEGVPGTLIDAYFSGVPVIAPLWENYSDVLVDDYTGWSYEFDDFDGFVDKLKKMYDYQELFYSLKRNCITFAERFSSDRALDKICSYLV